MTIKACMFDFSGTLFRVESCEGWLRSVLTAEGVSATGAGEYFIRVGVARDICARMELRHESAERASQDVFAELDAIHGDGGVIVMDRRGHTAWRFNTSGMYRARLEQGGRPVVQIFANE